MGRSKSGAVPTYLDARGPRFAATITSIVLAIALLGINTALFPILVIAQALVFAIGAAVGISGQPYVWLHTRLIASRLSDPKRMQNPTAPRFAQAIGFLLLIVGLVAWFLGSLVIAATAVAAAWVVALTLALTGFCVGCETYTVWKSIGSGNGKPS
jgi:hypothetical protein